MNGRLERWVEDERRCWRAALVFSGLAHAALLGLYALRGWLTPEAPRAAPEPAPFEVEVTALTAADLEQLMSRSAPRSSSGFARPDSRRAASRLAGLRPTDIDALLPPDPSRLSLPEASAPPGTLRFLEANAPIGTEQSLFNSRRRRRVEVDLDLLADVVGTESAVPPAPAETGQELLDASLLNNDLARSILTFRVEPRDEERWRRLGMAGVGLYEFRIDPEGLVSAVDVVQSTGYAELDLAAIEALRAWQFDPEAMDRLGAPYRFRQRFTW